MNGTAKLGSTDLSVSIHIRQAERQTTDIFTNLRVSNLESTTTAEDLRKMFEVFGEITSTFIPQSKSE
jgi:RNA recognition motif-containing protein